jgi:hypothetical protein
METNTILTGLQRWAAWPAVESLNPPSLGDQQNAMALAALAAAPAVAPNHDQEGPAWLICPHCAAEVPVAETERNAGGLFLRAICRRCGCRRTAYVEGPRPAPRLRELAVEASFD